jgi:homoserine kinase type II
VLWRGEALAGLLDFESASEEPLVFDLAVTMLAWCYGDDLDAGLVRALFGGYQAARPLEEGDRAALFGEARLAALRFTVTRVTDYAMRAHTGANAWRDWRRFAARLARLDALGPAGLAAAAGVALP